ncbi:TetR/AcrR family transcriptional regulator [Celeribacter indicus]|uniref:TetR family transcriptional regulator n=1 Tax=Celeribacter indicus TaxID=1208324 RepID=A0A0B5DQX0_9RHOB|nr:TetR/AcrR family transcriptional regulator [Celeribacter indicus]AJE45489.1 TetR family transcriptional regulator [Celeribacter indicus]
MAVLLEAAARILEEDGPEALTTNHIARRAGVSVGSLYQYFPSKEAILAELIREVRREMCDDILRELAYVAGQPLNFGIARLIRAVIHHHVHRAHRARLLEHLEERLPPDPESRALEIRAREAVTAYLAEHRVAEAEHAAFDLLNLVVGIAHPALHAGESDFEALARRIEPAAFGYLGLAPLRG